MHMHLAALVFFLGGIGIGIGHSHQATKQHSAPILF
jgi:hypothetical protein